MSNTAEELTLRINGESQGGQAAVQSFIGSLEGLKGHAEGIASVLEHAFTNPGAAVEELGAAVRGLANESFGGLAQMLSGPVVEGLVGVAAAVAVLGPALYELGQHATESAAAIERVSLTTGIAVPGLTDLKFAVEATGGSLDQLNTLMFMFEQRMENSSSKVEAGLKLIGLSLADIKDLQPDQAILAISDAMRHAESGTNLAAAAMDLFGRQGRAALPELLGPMSELAEKSKEFGGITADAAERAHEFEIAHKTMALETERAWTALGLAVAPITNAISLGFERMKLAIANVAVAAADLMSGYGWFSALSDWETGINEQTPKVNDNLKGLADHSGLAAKGLHDWNEEVKALAAHAPTLEEALATDKAATADLTERMKEAHKEEEKRLHDKDLYDKALRNILDVETGYKRLLEEISDDTVQAIFYDLQHKASVEDIARVYELTTTQVRILDDTQKQHQKDEADALKEFDREHAETFKLAQQHEKDWRTEQDKALKDMNKEVADTVQATKGYTNDYYDLVEKRTLSATDYEKSKIHEWEQKQLDAFHGTEAQWGAYYSAVHSLTDEKLRALEQKHDAVFKDIQQMLTDMAGADGQTGWGKHFSTVLVETGSFKDAMGAIWTDIKSAVKKILADMLSDFIDGYLGSAARALGSWLGSLGGGGGGSWWQSLLGALIPGFGGGGGSSTPVTPGYFDADGNWIPYPSNDPIPGHSGPTDPTKEAMGGIIPDYFARGGFPGSPSGTDTVPAWMTPGEGVLNVRAMARVGRENLNLLNAGARVSDLPASGRKVEVHVHVEGHIWALADLTKAVAQQLADDFQQVGGLLALDH